MKDAGLSLLHLDSWFTGPSSRGYLGLWLPWEFSSVNRTTTEMGEREAFSFYTPDCSGDGTALQDASASLVWQWAEACACVRECVNVFECVSQCLVFRHNALLFRRALPPNFSSTSVPTLSPHTAIQRCSLLFLLFFFTLTHLFANKRLLFSITLLFFLFNLSNGSLHWSSRLWDVRPYAPSSALFIVDMWFIAECQIHF